MIWIVIKYVYGCKYFWNDEKMQWEGLIDNATFFEDKLFAELAQRTNGGKLEGI